MTQKKGTDFQEQKSSGTMKGALNEKGTAYFGYRKLPAKEKIDWVQRHFDTVAPKYDFMNSLLSFGIHHPWKRMAVRLLQLKAGEAVIDLCGGTGDLSVLAARDVGDSGRVVLYDINRAMVKRGKERVINASFGNRVMCVQGDAERLSIADGAFDAAMVGFGIRNLTDMERGFSEMCRVLKPGGRLMCLEFSTPTAPLFRSLYDFYSFFIMPFLGQLLVGSRSAYTYLPESIRMFASPEALSALLEKVGFANVTYRRLTNGIAVIHLGKKAA